MATSLAAFSSRNFSVVSSIVMDDAIGILLPEMIVSVNLLLMKAPSVVVTANVVPVLGSLLDLLDRFNRLAPGEQGVRHRSISR